MYFYSKLVKKNVIKFHWICYRDFISECLKSPPVRPYEISVEQKALWTFLFGTMLFIAIIGNSIVIWIVLGTVLQEQIFFLNFFSTIENNTLMSLCTYTCGCMYVCELNLFDLTIECYADLMAAKKKRCTKWTSFTISPNYECLKNISIKNECVFVFFFLFVCFVFHLVKAIRFCHSIQPNHAKNHHRNAWFNRSFICFDMVQYFLEIT